MKLGTVCGKSMPVPNFLYNFLYSWNCAKCVISKHVPKCIFAERDKLVVLVGKETLERIIICYISHM